MGGLGPKHVDTHTRCMQLRLYYRQNKEQVNNGRLPCSIVSLAVIYISAAIMGEFYMLTCIQAYCSTSTKQN